MSSSGSLNGAAGAAAPTTVDVSIAELEQLCNKALTSLGYQPAEVDILREVMMYSQLRGGTQGVIKITTGAMARNPAATPLRVERETPLSALLDGGGGPGMLALRQAADLAAVKAKQSGFGIVGTHNTASSTGALAYYAERLGRQGLIALVLAQSPEYVAPHGAREAIFGTNPIAVGIPASEGPVVLDMATAAYAWFGLLEAQTAGRAIPPDVGMDAQGRPTSDPGAVLDGGALRVFDRGAKGSGLALMVELLAGPLVGAAVADKLHERNWGNLVLALDPALLGDRQLIAQRTQLVLDRVRGAQRLPGVERITLPGERGAAAAAAALAAGRLALDPSLLGALREMVRTAEASGSGGGAGAGAGTAGWRLATRLLHPAPGSWSDPFDASGPPLYQTATFGQPGATECGPYDYTRSGNPTRTMLEEAMADLEGADRAFAFTSGMAALAVAVKLAVSGQHIVAGDDIYGGTSRLLSQVVPGFGISVSNVDMTDISAVRAAIIPGKTAVVMVESPTNPRMQVCDIRAIVDVAHAAGALVVVDNSFMSPLFQLPLQLGADISMISGTKFIGGHGDTTLGVLAVKGQELAKRVYFLQNAEGAGLAPFDCWLALRGLKTMALRLERSAANAARMAAWLAAHPLVKRVNYAGLASHPGADLHARQAGSGGAVLSFETGDLEVSKIVVERTKLFKITVSFGNVVSLISLPCYMSHASIPAEVRAARGLPDDLVRISAGIEDVDDLIADLAAAFDEAAAAVRARSSSSSSAAGGNGGGGGVSQVTEPVTYHFGGNGSSGNGGGNGAGGATAREAALLERVRQLEALLQHTAVGGVQL